MVHWLKQSFRKARKFFVQQACCYFKFKTKNARSYYKLIKPRHCRTLNSHTQLSLPLHKFALPPCCYYRLFDIIEHDRGVTFSQHKSHSNCFDNYLVKDLLTPRSRVLLEKLTGLQLVRKFPAFYGTRRFITAFTSACHLSLIL
jgi:hypothetical protein